MATIADHIDTQVFEEKLQNVLLGMMGDSVFAIREEVINSVIKLSKSKFDQRWMESILTPKLDEYSKHTTFMMRQHTVFYINKIIPVCSSNFTNSVIAPILLKLAEDPVPNIRFNVAKTVALCHRNMSVSNVSKMKDTLRKIATEDKDFDA
jgi:serine/threonine-protein phosphatase 2A regulatory subunit A